MFKIFTTTFVLLFSVYGALAQQDVKLNLMSATSQRLEVSYEIPALPNIGLEPIVGLNFRKWADGTSINGQDISVKRFGWIAGFKGNFYFGHHDDLTGFYISPYAIFRSDKIDFQEPTRHTRLSTGLMIGQKGFIWERLGYSVEGGLGYNPIYKYNDVKTGAKVELEESIPILGSLTKINIPFRVSLFYRISE